MAKSMGTTQFMNAKLASEKPIFTRAKINHIPPHPVLQLLATNKRIVLVLANRSIQRVDQQHEIEHIDLTKFMEGKFKVHSAHLDPSGHHLFVSLKSSDHESLPDVIYIPPKQTQVRSFCIKIFWQCCQKIKICQSFYVKKRNLAKSQNLALHIELWFD